MAILFSIDNDRVLTGEQQLTLDETAGTQTILDTNGAPNDVDDDVGATYNSGTNVFGSATLDAAFVAFISGLFPTDPARDAALDYVASVGGASSSDTFIQVTANAGETIQNLFFSIAPGNPTGLIAGMTTLDGSALYFHIDTNTDFATLTTAADATGRIVAAFYLDEDDDGVGVDHLTAQVQMVTFEPIKHTVTTDHDDALSFTDVLRVSAAGSTNFTFDNLPSGNFLYAAFGNTTSALLVTGDVISVQHDATNKNGEVIKNATDTVNTSQAAPGSQATIGIEAQHFTAGGQGQNLTDGSVAVFTLVSGFVPLTGSAVPATGTNVQDIDFGGYINTDGAGIDISQLTGGSPHADLKISLWEAGGGTTPEEKFGYIDTLVGADEDPVDNETALHDDDPIAVGQVKVTHLGVVLTFNVGDGAHQVQSGITVDFISSNTFTVKGLAGLDKVDWTTVGGDTFNRFKIQALATTSQFDLGGVHINKGTTEGVGLGSHLFVDDDGPSAGIVDGAGAVTVDETTGDDADADDTLGTTTLGGVALSTVFGVANVANQGSDGAAFPQYAISGAPLASASTSSFGTDAAGGTKVLSLEIVGGNNTNSGLTTTDDKIIRLVKEGNLIVGRVDSDNDGSVNDGDAGDVAVFAIALDQDGNVATAQYRSLTHGSAGDGTGGTYDEQVDLTGLVNMKVLVTDGDGDTANASVGIGNDINFEDDGPTAGIGDGAGAVTVDETTGDDADADDTLGTTTLGGVALSTVFGVANVPNPGSDGAAFPQYAISAAPLASTSTSSFGQDNEGGTKALSLEIVGGDGTDSLLDTTDGKNILLFKEGNLIVGRYDVANGQVTSADPAAFAIALDQDGNVATVQFVSLKHGNTSSADEQVDLTGLVNMKVLVTDGDGDTANASFGIGNDINFEDDGPTAGIVDGTGAVTVDETPGDDADADDTLGTTTLGGVALSTVFGVANVPNPGSDGAAFPQYAISSAPLANTSTSSFGQDNEGGSKALSLEIVGGDGTDSLLDTTDGKNILLFKEGNLIVGRYDVANGPVTSADPAAFAIALDQDGNVATVQFVSLKHGNTSSADEQVDLTGLVNMKVVVTDGDGDTANASVGIGNDINFEDDGPSVTAVNVQVFVDDDGVPVGDGNPGGTGDSTAEKTTTGSITGLFVGGADGVQSFTMTIANFDAENPAPILYSQGGLLEYSETGDVLTGYVDDGQNTGYQAAEDREVFTFELNYLGVDGDFKFTLLDQIDHPTAGTEDDLDLLIGVVLQVVDNDGDVSEAAENAQLKITADDDSPIITTLDDNNDTSASNAVITTTGATGTFVYAIGFDDRVGTTYSATNTDLLVTFIGGTVGTTAITNLDIDWFSEDADGAVFNFTFTYVSDPTNNTTTNNGGTLTFDKDPGSYTFKLTNPVSSFGILSLADASGFTGYLPNSATTDNSQPEVTVAALASDFFVQFTGAQETGGGTDGNNAAKQALIGNNKNLDALAPGEAWSNVDDDQFSTHEVFTQTRTWVSVSGTAAGTAGDTMQSGEVLDFNFFAEDPKGHLTDATAATLDKATTATMFIEFDALDNGEDLVVVLKLVDKNDSSITTTRAVVVEFNDIFHIQQAADIPEGFVDPDTIDQNDGLVVIESNDYNFGGTDNWTIAGAQVVASTEGITLAAGTSAINLNRTMGTASGASTFDATFNGTQDSGGNTGGTWDGDVFKIVNIGFLTEITPDSEFNFGVQVIDFDGDTSASQTLTIDVLGVAP